MKTKLLILSLSTILFSTISFAQADSFQLSSHILDINKVILLLM